MFRVGVLCARRLPSRRIRLGTDRSDKLLLPLLSATVLLGITATAAHNVFGASYDYRSTVSVWFRGLVPAPRPVREFVRDTHGMLLGAWYALLALTRFWSYWSTLL